MHDGMPCGPIQGQGQGHMALKVRYSSIYDGSWQVNADSKSRGKYLNLLRLDF